MCGIIIIIVVTKTAKKIKTNKQTNKKNAFIYVDRPGHGYDASTDCAFLLLLPSLRRAR